MQQQLQRKIMRIKRTLGAEVAAEKDEVELDSNLVHTDKEEESTAAGEAHGSKRSDGSD